MLLLLGISREHEEVFALRIARAALRAGGRADPARAARWAIRWMADGLDRRTISSSVLRQPPLTDLHARLRLDDVERLQHYAGEDGRRRGSRRWLQDNADEVGQRFDR